MSNYVKATNFATKDTLPTGNPNKIVKGVELNSEFDAIAVAVATKQDTLPTGIIVMWSGATNAVPTGWALCNGTNGTPDLRDRFIVGAGGNYGVGGLGGAASSTLNTAAGGEATVNASNTSLSVPIDGWGTSGGAPGTLTNGRLVVGSGQNEVNEALESIRTAGSDRSLGTHNHTVAVPAHTHSVTVSTLPPYLALAYIMKL